MVLRTLPLPAVPTESFFLWGPRQTGKSSLLRERYPQAVWRDLLDTDLYLRYTQRPHYLREELAGAAPGSLVVLDEIQKVPALLDEVHAMIEEQGLVFVLCGSSARKLRRGHANLLGGRALRYELFGLVSQELGSDFNLLRAVNSGGLPRHYLAERPQRRLQAYVNDYLKEEVANEGLVRNLPAFSHFLRAAVLSDAELVNFTNIARECAVSSPTVKEYFQILVDTLLGRFLEAYTSRPKRRTVASPKFYFADIGVVNAVARRGNLSPGTELFGKALESWICHELHAWGQYSETFPQLTYWRLTSGVEVDFVINDAQFALEVKSTTRVDNQHLKGLRQFRAEHPGVQRLFLACLERFARRTDDGLEIVPIGDLLRRLWDGELFS